MEFLIASLVIVAIALMIVVSQRQSVNSMKKRLSEAQQKAIQLEQKIETSRGELKKSKEELEREKTALRDARELNKKKLRRQANVDEKDFPKGEAAMTDKALDDKEIALKALEAQIEHMKKEQLQNEDAIRARLSDEMDKKAQERGKEVDELKKKISDLQEELKKQRRLMRPEGHKIDLKTLPDEAASEFARVFRKAEQHERLHGIARAKLHLAQEKFTELQKRYFTVCRELAVLAGNQSEVDTKESGSHNAEHDSTHDVTNSSTDAERS